MGEAPPVRSLTSFLRAVLRKAHQDEIFLLAGAISFNLLIAMIPLMVLILGVSGFVVSARFGDPSEVIVTSLLGPLPVGAGDLDIAASLRQAVDRLVDSRGGFSLVGAIIFLWLSTRLVGSLRTALRHIFQVGDPRGLLWGKVFDIQIVLVGTVLILVNVGITVTLGMVKDFGVDFLGLTGPALGFSEQFFALVVAFTSLWVFVLLIYRFVPADRTPWRVALVAATFTALVLELMKYGFGWYVISAADYRSTYGNLATLAVLLFWIYYGAVAFVLGGEVAHVHGERTELATDPEPSFGVNVRP